MQSCTKDHELINLPVDGLQVTLEMGKLFNP